jgi:pilus assembly protein CpaB
MKNQRAVVLFSMAIAFGSAAAFLAQRLLDVEPTAAAAVVEVRPVVVAKVDLSVSTELTPDKLETRDWPVEFLPDGVFHQAEGLASRVLRRTVAAGEVIQESGLMVEGSRGGLVGVIQDKQRAISVKVDPIIGVAGFVKPGSYVDVLATLRRFDWDSKQPYAKAIIQNVKVLAIDQKLEDVAVGEPELVSVVTLEVTPGEAEKLTFMSHEGKLQLALRSPQDHEIVKTRGAYVGGMLASAPTVKRNAVQILKGTSVSKKAY